MPDYFDIACNFTSQEFINKTDAIIKESENHGVKKFLAVSSTISDFKTIAELRKSYPNYFISKRKIMIDENIDFDQLIKSISNRYSNEMISNIDGLKIDFKNSWVQLRKSNTEPIIRVYAEAKSKEKAEELSKKFLEEIRG